MTSTRSISDLLKAAFLRIGLGLPLVALLILLPAGRWDYWQGWMYLATLFIPMFFVLAYLFKNDPALLERRLHTREREAAQRKIIKVVSTGPYAIVRHPMYAGVSLMYLASPVALGSCWALIPALLIIPLLVARIFNEEQALLGELPGYAEYRQKVRYRLLPGVW